MQMINTVGVLGLSNTKRNLSEQFFTQNGPYRWPPTGATTFYLTAQNMN